MLIRDWMSKEVISVSPDTTMMQASRLLRDKKIRRLPVVDETGVVIGIVTDRDMKEASPSKATTLDMHELYYLLSEITVQQIMTPNPVTISPAETVEKAALVMIEKRVGGLPVVDASGRAVGVITDSDIFKVLIAITGVRHGGVQLGLELQNHEGSLRNVLDDLRENGARIVSILTSLESPDALSRRVTIRIMPMERTEENRIVDAIKCKYPVLFWARDTVHVE